MPDIKQSLRDFVATSNSGKYSDEKVLLSKFPELSGYDVNSLKDFVATSNSGKYADENELFSKFPEFKTGAQPAAVQPPVKKKKLESPSVFSGIISSLVPSVKEEQQPAVSSSVKKAEAPVDINKGTEKGEIYKGLPIKGFEDKSYVLKNVNGIDVWQEYNPKNKDVVIGKANKYLSLSKEGVAEGGFSGGEKQKNAKLALTQLAGKLGVDVSSTDGPDDIYQKIQSSKEIGETYKNITDPTRIKTLNQNFKTQASTKEGVQTYVGYPEKSKEDNEYRISELPITKEKVWEVKRKGQKEFTVISDEGSIKSLNDWTGNNIEVSNDAKTKRDAQIARQESAVNNFKLVNSKMFDLAEEDAVPYLQKVYGKYGFNFAESGDLLKDEVTVTSKNGGKPITFSLDNWTQGADASESAKLRRWMIENQSTGDYIDKEREAVKQAQDDYRNSKYEQEKLTLEQIELQSTSDLQRPIISNPLDAKNKLSAPAEFKQELAANTIMTNKINAQRRLSDLSNSAKTQKQKDEVATIAVANQNVLKQESDVQATYLNDLSKQNKQLNNSVFKLKQDSERFYNGLKQQGITPEQLNTDPELLRQKQELDERAKSIESVSKNLSADMSAIESLNKENQKNAGLYIAFNENRGNVMGGLVNSVLKGVGALPDAILNNISGGDDNFASNALISLLGSDYTTEEFMKSEDRWDLTKAAFGGVESLGAMATGAGLSKFATGSAKLMAISEEIPFTALSYNEIKSEMSGPEWDNVPKAEKEAMALMYAFVNGKLEKLGTDALVGTGKIGKDISKNLILKTIAGLKPGATTDAMNLALEMNFKKFILSSAYTLGKDFANEAKTGAMQELAGITLKNTYNLIKGKEMFKEVPNTIADITDAVISGAYMEGLGGLAFSMPKVAVDAGKFGYSKAFKDPEKLAFAEKIFNDSDMRVMILNDLKTKIASGEITKEEGQERVDAINSTVSLFEKLPDGLREEDKPKTLDLLVEKSKLEQDIKGKDEALIVPQKERITEINNELTNISKNATKENNIEQQKGTTEGSTVEYQGVNEGQPEVGQGDGTVGQTTEQATDTGDSTVASGENQKKVEQLRADEQKAKKPSKKMEERIAIEDKAREVELNRIDEEKNQARESIMFPYEEIGEKKSEQEVKDEYYKARAESDAKYDALRVKIQDDKKEVERLRRIEQVELAEVIPNIDEYKVDGEIDKSLMDKPTLAKYEKIYKEFDKLITPLLPKTEKQPTVKTEEVITDENSIDVFHGGSVESIDNVTKDSPLFVSEDESQAKTYAKGNKGKVAKFKIDKTKVANEEEIYQAIDDLGLKSKDEEWNVKELNIFELIDPRFDTSLSEEDIVKLYDELEKRGYGAAKFTDTDLDTDRQEIENIVVFNPEIATGKAKEQPPAKTEEQPIAETTENESINKKIDETESKQESEVKSTGANIETTKAKKAKSIPRTSQALDVDTTNLEHIVYKYFIRGGKIDVAKTAQSLFGTKSSMSTRSIKSEYQKRIGLHKKGAPTIGRLARDLWEENQDQFGESITDQDWRNAVEAVFNSHNGTKRMIEELLAIDVNATVDAENKYWEDNYGEDLSKQYDESELMDAESVLDNMTDEEIIQLAQEIEASEKESVEKAEQPTTLEEAKSLDTTEEATLKDIEDAEKELKELEDLLEKIEQKKKEKIKEKTIDESIKESLSNEEIEDAAKEQGVTVDELIKIIKENVFKPIANLGSYIKEKTKKLIKKVRQKLLTIVFGGVMLTSTLGFTYDNNGRLVYSAEQLVDSILPDSQAQQVKRWLDKNNYLENQDIEITNKKESTIKETPQVEKSFEVIGTIPDSYNPSDSLLSYRSQWDNSKGFEYIPAPVKRDLPSGGMKISGVVGVGHFLLDASAAGKTYSHEYNKKFLERAKQLNHWIPTFTRMKNGRVLLKYKKFNEINQKDIVLSPLRQFNFSDIDFSKTQTPSGFKNSVKEVKTKDGKGTYLLFKSRDGYSRFSGGSVVFIFKDSYGNTIVRDFAGSLNQIENEGINIKKAFNLKDGDLTIGYHDVGSFSAKPKAKEGVIDTEQWDGFNNEGMTGGALLIPIDGNTSSKTPAESGGGLLALLALVKSLKRKLESDEELSDSEILDIKNKIKTLKEEIEKNKQKESEASKAAKNISKKDNTKITVTERVALKDQLRLEAKAARESAMNIQKNFD